ncbi:hypothetical protein CHS0354_024161 [Potamilus streckersoni]|uniref:DUF1343 domain-containing protein n=1 Tax=Potamilus streckersoni TaxID=2493646 RepID=A0AAE0RZG9_9BIVA|nr:hypothetical protein CHS0354_024161 [Potamilus streckersoni]
MKTAHPNIFLFACAVTFAFASTAFGQVTLGIDVLTSQKFDILSSKRVGLISNHSSLNAFGVPTHQLFIENNINLTAIFAPEHGFRMNKTAGETIPHQTWHNIPIFSLYGKTKTPTPDMLKNIDIFVFDLQDAGVRPFTFVSTMFLAMKAAARVNIPFVVLERPNPIGYFKQDGFSLDTTFRSFVSLVNIPFIHAMTTTEIAKHIQQTELPTLTLYIINMKNYIKESFLDELILSSNSTHLHSIMLPLSPNLTTQESLICYPISVLLEPTNVSEGRGTDKPFQIIGAPFINSDELILALPKPFFTGIELRPISFVPQSQYGKVNSPKYKGKQCYGIYFKITNRNEVKPFHAAVALLVTLVKQYPTSFKFNQPNFFDKLAGTNMLRLALNEGKSVDEILKLAHISIAK